MLSPALVAVMSQLPEASVVIVPMPSMEQMAGVEVAKVIEPVPLPPVTFACKPASPTAAVAGAVSTSAACDASDAAVDVVTDVAAEYAALPACVAVSTHAAVPLVIVTVLPVSEQPPDATTETVRPDDALGAIVNVEPLTAVAGAVSVIVCAVWCTATDLLSEVGE